MKQDNRTLDWLGLRSKIDTARTPVVGKALGWLITAIILAIAFGSVMTLIFFLGLFFGFSETPPADLHAAIRNVGLVLVAAVGAPFVAWRSIVAQRQVDTAQATLINEKINAATDGLHAQRQVTKQVSKGKFETHWEDDIIRRSAAIDQLEALAKEEPSEARRIARMLCTYVKELSREYPAEAAPDKVRNATWASKHEVIEAKNSLYEWSLGLRLKRADMERATQSLSRLNTFISKEENKLGLSLPEALKGDLWDNPAGRRSARSGFRNWKSNVLSLWANEPVIDLRGANLQKMDLSGLDLNHANLRNVALDGAEMAFAEMSAARLDQASLNQVNLCGATLAGASLTECTIRCSNMEIIQSQGADLSGAYMAAVELDEAELQNSKFGNATLFKTSFHEAQMQGTRFKGAFVKLSNFSFANLRGANFQYVRCHNSDFNNIELDEETRYTFSDTTGCNIRSVHVLANTFNVDQLSWMFGDATVKLLGSEIAPSHWPTNSLRIRAFHAEFDHWQSNPDTYDWADRKHLYTEGEDYT